MGAGVPAEGAAAGGAGQGSTPSRSLFRRSTFSSGTSSTAAPTTLGSSHGERNFKRCFSSSVFQTHFPLLLCTCTRLSESQGIFKVSDTSEFARTWGMMKSNRSEEMNYEKMSRAMRYHYGSEKQVSDFKQKHLF